MAASSRSSYGLCCACLLLAVGLQFCFPFLPPSVLAQESSGGYILSTEVRLVVLPVTVRDRQGHSVSGLKESNFQVYDEGQAQNITVFRDADVPVTAGLVVDHSGSMATKRHEVIKGAVAFVQDSNPQDREFVVNFGDTVSFGLPEHIKFTSNIEDLRAALLTPYAFGKTALYDALAAALEHLRGDPLDKKVLLLISDGGDNASKHDFSHVLRMAQASSVVIYSIGLLDDHSADQNPRVLGRFARDTGGQVYFPNTPVDVVSVCRQIAVDIRHQYTLGYSPADTGRTGYRNVRVKVNAPGRGKLLVRTRSGYFLPPSTAGNLAAPQQEGR